MKTIKPLSLRLKMPLKKHFSRKKEYIMTFFKKLVLTLTSCCLVMCGCGKTDAEESDIPDGIINVEVTTQPETEKTDEQNAAVTTTAPIFQDDFDWTVTTVKTARPYRAEAHNNYTPVQTSAARKPVRKTTTKAKGSAANSVTTVRRTGTSPTFSGSPNHTVTISGTAVTVVTTISSSKKTTTASTSVTTGKSPQLKLMENMTLEEKVCQMFIVTPEQLTGSSSYITEADKEIKKAIEKYSIGGVIFSEENLESKNQITAMLRNMQSYSKDSSGAGLFTVIQEEGGDISPAAGKLGINNPGSMASLGTKNNADDVYDAGKLLGSELKKLGFNVDLAPVADLGTNSKNGLGDRVFSSDAEISAKMVAKLVSGLTDSGVAPVLSHFPGIGAYDGKSALIKRSLSQLRKEEFLPFKSGIAAGADFVLVSHHVISGIGDDLPSDLSYTAVTGILRNELGFGGIIITDSHKDPDFTKKYTAEKAAVMAVNAGVDIILLPDDLPDAVKAICEAVENGEIREERINESVLRILSAKAEMGLIRS